MTSGRVISCPRAILALNRLTRGRIMNRKAQVQSLLVSLLGIVFFAPAAMAQNETKPPATYPALPSEIPAKFTPKNDSFDYTRRTVMIPMRDGVKLHTVILIPSP